MEPLVFSHWGIWVLHNPVLEWLLAGHLAGWHHSCAGLTSPCFSGVILAGCGSCSLPLPPVARDWCNLLLCFWTAACHSLQPAVRHVQGRVSQEWALFIFKMILVLHSLSCCSFCFLWPRFILLACSRGQGGTCPRALYSVFSHSQTVYWLVLSVTTPQNPCQRNSHWSVFVFLFEAGSEDTSVDCFSSFVMSCLFECWLTFCVLS